MTKDKLNFKIALTGDLGSGKSTVCKILKSRLGAEVVSIGSLQRKLAAERGMSTLEFNGYMETHPEIDLEFDRSLMEYDKVGGNFLFDSRLAFHFIPSAFGVYITTEPYTAAARVYNAGRSGEGYSDIDDAVRGLKERRESEIFRYKKIYGVDITDMNNYALVVDSTAASPERVADLIVSEYAAKAQKGACRHMLIAPVRIIPAVGAANDGPVSIVRSGENFLAVSGVAALAKALAQKESVISCTLSASAASADYALKERFEKDFGIKFARI